MAARHDNGAGEAGWTARLDVHIGDLRAAHSWLTGHDTELSLRMRAELHWYALFTPHVKIVQNQLSHATANLAG